MGVLYHRRSPLEHLWQLKDQLVSGGELVLESSHGTRVIVNLPTLLPQTPR